MEDTKIQYRMKEVFGVPRIYIVDETHARNIKTVTGNSTLIPSKMNALKNLGIVFEQIF